MYSLRLSKLRPDIISKSTVTSLVKTYKKELAGASQKGGASASGKGKERENPPPNVPFGKWAEPPNASSGQGKGKAKEQGQKPITTEELLRIHAKGKGDITMADSEKGRGKGKGQASEAGPSSSRQQRPAQLQRRESTSRLPRAQSIFDAGHSCSRCERLPSQHPLNHLLLGLIHTLQLRDIMGELCAEARRSQSHVFNC
ncbi:hypothetical protein BC835DRAFT_655701 [Cytidiella melzeri]|nr:hypothetical protein BC835DRAFT_655701 [Cytidiella melzeri]